MFPQDTGLFINVYLLAREVLYRQTKRKMIIYRSVPKENVTQKKRSCKIKTYIFKTRFYNISSSKQHVEYREKVAMVLPTDT
jgi:hypothetical protein